MDDVKLCRDCRHLTLGDQCRKSPKPLDFVHGKPSGWYPAQAERQTNGGCGPNARWWEAK